MPARRQRWKRRKEERPKEILSAALDVFAAKGFAAARMDDIAARARVSKGTLYRYYKSKEDVFRALVRAAIVPNVAAAEDAVANMKLGAKDTLRFIVTRMSQVIRQGKIAAVPKLVLAESGNFPKLARFYKQEVIARGLKLLSGVIERGVASGEFAPVKGDFAARLCVAPLLMMALWRMTFAAHDTEPFDEEGFVATHLDVLTKGLSATQKEKRA